jgi:hypothetical protein
MMNPFRIVWELIEGASTGIGRALKEMYRVGIQALFVYILAIILIVGFVHYHEPKAVVSLQEKFDKIWDREKIKQ